MYSCKLPTVLLLWTWTEDAVDSGTQGIAFQARPCNAIVDPKEIVGLLPGFSSLVESLRLIDHVIVD